MKPWCPECLEPDEDPRAWCDCRSDEPPCGSPCRQRAHDPAKCPNREPESTAEWVDGCTWFDLRPDDLFRWNGHEGIIETITIGDWNVREGDRSWQWNGGTYYNDEPWKHQEVRVRIVGRDGMLTIAKPGARVEIFMNAERRALHALHQAGLKLEAL